MKFVNLIKGAVVLGSVVLMSGCGGGGSDIAKKIDLKKLITNKTFYAVDTCKDPNYFSEKYTSSKLTLQTYSDDNFTDEVEKRIYSIKEFTNDDLILVRDNIEYTCGIDYDYLTDSKKITEMALHCDSDNVNADNLPYVVVYPTKELAIKNKNTECD